MLPTATTTQTTTSTTLITRLIRERVLPTFARLSSGFFFFAAIERTKTNYAGNCTENGAGDSKKVDQQTPKGCIANTEYKHSKAHDTEYHTGCTKPAGFLFGNHNCFVCCMSCANGAAVARVLKSTFFTSHNKNNKTGAFATKKELQSQSDAAP